MSEITITLPRLRSWWKVALGAALAVAVIAFAVPQSRDAIGRTWEPRRVADRSVLAAQREGLEQALARVYAKGADQLHSAGQLTLPISDAEAAAIERKSLDELRAIRRNALATSARFFGLTPAETDGYLRAIEPQLDKPQAETSSGVLLAPALYGIVARAAELSAQAADEGTRELTRPRTAPRPSPSPTPRT